MAATAAVTPAVLWTSQHARCVRYPPRMQAPTTFPLVDRLAFARENFTPGLERGYEILTHELTERGCRPGTLVSEHPRAHADIAAVVLITSATFLCVAALRRSRRPLLGVATGLVALSLLAAGALPLPPRGALKSIEVIVEPRTPPRQEVVLATHYDTKTELLDHVERAVLFYGAALLFVWACVATWRRAQRAYLPAALATLALVACALQLVSGRFLTSRSPGVVDNAVGCAVLVDVATQLHAAPLERTRVRCLWFAAEELGALASASYARRYRPSVPVRVLNLEGIGAGSTLAWGMYEWTRRGPRRTDAQLAFLLEQVAPGARRVRVPVFTDAGSFLRAGVPALTLLNLPASASFVRGLHGPGDNLERFDPSGAVSTRQTLLTLLARLDVGAPQ